METATDTNSTTMAMKRARFNFELVSDLTTQATSKTAPPKGLAESLINKSIASLHPEYATIVGRLGKEHLTLLSKLEHKKKQKQRLIDESAIIPRSARIQFEISASKRAEKTPEFIKLKSDTAATIELYNGKLRDHVVAGLAIEITALTNEIKEHLAEAIHSIVKSHMIVTKDHSNVHVKVDRLMKKYIDSITVNVPTTLKDFNDIYKNVLALANHPPIQPARETPDDMDFSDSLVLTGK